MGDQHAFWLSGRAGSIDAVAGHIGCDRNGWCKRSAAVKQLAQLLLGETIRRRAILQDKFHPLPRIVHIHRHIGSAGFQNTQQRRKQHPVSRQHNGHQLP